MKIRGIGNLIKSTVTDWIGDRSFELGAAIAYYSIFSLAPVLIIAITIAGFVFGEQAAQGQVSAQIEGIVGPQGAGVVESMIQSTRQTRGSGIATIVGIVILLVGATGVFSELKQALNQIWEVEDSGGGVKGMARNRLAGFLIVLSIGLLLLLLIIASAVVGAVLRFVPDIPGGALLLRGGEVLISLVVLTLLFALIYKLLPDCDVAWRDVWVGAAVTGALFTLGKLGIGMYLGRSAVSSTYGAAGSVIVILLGIYYCALIFLLGAEFTRAYADYRGSACGRQATARKHERRQRVRPAQATAPAGAREGLVAGGSSSARSVPAVNPAPRPKESSSKREDKHMSTETEYLSTEAKAAKAAMQETLQEIKQSARRAADPRGWAREYPWAAVGITVVAGLLVGGVLFGRRGRRRAEVIREPETLSERLRGVFKGEAAGKKRSRDHDEGRGIGGALIAGAAALAANALKETLRTAVTTAISAKTAKASTPDRA